MRVEMDGNGDIVSRLQEHHGRVVIESLRKFRWRYTTLSSDCSDLMSLRQRHRNVITDEEQQLRERGYLFEVERRLHHYLSGFYTFAQIVKTLRDGVSSECDNKIGQRKGSFGDEKSVRLIFGLRHYIQHENVLPVKWRDSSLNDRSEVILLTKDLHRNEGYKRGFDSHYGHLDEPLFNPFAVVEQSWNHTEQLHEDVVSIIINDAGEDISEYNELVKDFKHIIEEVQQDLLESVEDS